MNLGSQIENELAQLGILCRVFSRAKDPHSIERKILVKGYDATKKLQDLIGVRIALYFRDDVELVTALYQTHPEFHFCSETIDRHTNDTFCPTRVNIILGVPSDQIGLLAIPPDKPIDNTFELQIRTILSEGWHEVEHDLRYKRSDDWKPHPELSRSMNGILASLETAEWSMEQIFSKLAYSHYKSKNFEAMIHARFRVRITSSPADTTTLKALGNYPEVQKGLLRWPRSAFFEALRSLKGPLPITVSNIVFLYCSKIENPPKALINQMPNPVRQVLDPNA